MKYVSFLLKSAKWLEEIVRMWMKLGKAWEECWDWSCEPQKLLLFAAPLLFWYPIQEPELISLFPSCNDFILFSEYLHWPCFFQVTLYFCLRSKCQYRLFVKRSLYACNIPYRPFIEPCFELPLSLTLTFSTFKFQKQRTTCLFTRWSFFLLYDSS